MIGWPLPLVALQILWLNLITDIFPAFALAMEPSAPGVMKRSPRDPNEPLLTRNFIGLIVWQGLLLAGVTLLSFWIGMHWHGLEGEGLRRATTMAFMTLALTQVFHAFDARSQSRSLFTNRLFTNGWLWSAVAICIILQAAAVYVPLLQKVLHTVPPTAVEWGVIVGCSLLPVVVIEMVKLIQRFTIRKEGESHV
jgi:Ca2+-transporting ATPase